MQITEHVHSLKIPFQIPVSPETKIDRFVNVFLIYGEDICLIDCGVASADKIIFDYIRSTGRSPEDVSLIIQTHSHPDHIGALKTVKEQCGCPVAAHASEVNWIEDVELQFRERPVPGFHSLVGGSTRVNRVLNDGDMLDLGGGLELEVIHTPGHSRGSLSFFLRDDGVLISGDALPLAGDMPIYEDVLASVDSIRKLQHIDGLKVLLSSWDEPRHSGDVKRVMEESLRWLQRIHESVIRTAGKGSVTEPMKLCAEVVEEIGLPPIAANPVVAGSFAANLRVHKCRDLLERHDG